MNPRHVVLTVGVLAVFLLKSVCHAAPLNTDELPEAPRAEEILIGQLSEEERADVRPYFDGKPDGLPPAKYVAHLAQLSDYLHEQEVADPEHFYTLRLDLRSGEIHGIVLNSVALGEWARAIAPNGIAAASDGGTVEDGSDVSKGLSSPGDNRILRNNPTQDTDPLLSKIGRLTTGCTGTMFSRQHVFTAAHCAINSSGYGLAMTFYPRERTTTTSPQTTTRPYGSSVADAVYFPSAWTSKGCNGSSPAADCHLYDWTIVHFPATFSPNPGYVGFGYYSDATIGSFYVTTAGYPGCGYSISPVGCVYPNQYQDVSCNSVHPVTSEGSTSNWWPYSDGTNPRIDYACDANEGQSGSGLFNSANNMLIGNVTNNEGGCYENCTGFSMLGIRISSTLFDYMLTFRNQAP